MADQITPRSGNQTKLEILPNAKIAAGTKIEQGKHYVFVGGFLSVPGPANAATGKRPVLALDTVDNTAGAAGDKTVDCSYGVMIDFANDSTHPVAQTHVGSLGYLSSPSTISNDSTDGPPCGIINSFNRLNSLPGRPVQVEVK